uniref:Uncharacterized protein n=1 Tax=Crocodylus porosus TaxID=8502 RepID=A0A7M4G2M4_CROPO
SSLSVPQAVVQVEGSLFSLNSTCTEADNFDKANITGEIEFAIKYIFKTCTLEVCINACKNLAYGEEKKKKYRKKTKASKNKHSSRKGPASVAWLSLGRTLCTCSQQHLQLAWLSAG